MKSLSLRRAAVGIAAASLSGAALASVPTSAHAAIDDSELGGYASINEYNACLLSPGPSAPSPLTWTDNGVPVTQSFSATRTATGGDLADVTDLTTSYSATVKSTPINGGPATITASARSRATAVPRLATTTCNAQAYASTEVEGEFTLAKPMWAVVTLTGGSGTNGGQSYVELYMEDGYLDVYAPRRTTSVTTVLLPAGDVDLDFETWTNSAYGNNPERHVQAAEGTMKVELFPVGHPSAAAGKGKGFVQLGARNCGNGAVAASLTKKVKKQAKSVTVKVNGKKAATFQGKKLKKRSFSLAAASSKKANVVATVTLKNGKKVTVTRSYLECS